MAPKHPTHHSAHAPRGDIAIYVALLVMTITLAGAVVLSGLLARQIRLGRSVVINERSFYAANSGLEHILYELNRKPQTKEAKVVPNPIPIEYDSDGTTATYTSQGKVLGPPNDGAICAYSDSTYQGNVGRLRSRAVSACPAEL